MGDAYSRSGKVVIPDPDKLEVQEVDFLGGEIIEEFSVGDESYRIIQGATGICSMLRRSTVILDGFFRDPGKGRVVSPLKGRSMMEVAVPWVGYREYINIEESNSTVRHLEVSLHHAVIVDGKLFLIQKKDEGGYLQGDELLLVGFSPEGEVYSWIQDRQLIVNFKLVDPRKILDLLGDQLKPPFGRRLEHGFRGAAWRDCPDPGKACLELSYIDNSHPDEELFLYFDLEGNLIGAEIK